MTYIDIDESLVNITCKICDNCKTKLNSILKENTTFANAEGSLKLLK